jgi:hypothetical protein
VWLVDVGNLAREKARLSIGIRIEVA